MASEDLLKGEGKYKGRGVQSVTRCHLPTSTHAHVRVPDRWFGCCLCSGCRTNAYAISAFLSEVAAESELSGFQPEGCA